MATKIFVNFPVKDLKKTINFFTQLGYTFNAQFTDENATCMIISEDIYAMLLVEKFWHTFTDKTICDPATSKEVMIALTTDSRKQVDEFVDKAIKAGATEPKPAQDHGFMYSRNFEDLDGHSWSILFMEPSFIQPA